MRKESSTVQKCKRQMATLGFDSQLAYHRVKLILKIYRDVVWVLSERVEELHEYAWELGAQDADTAGSMAAPSQRTAGVMAILRKQKITVSVYAVLPFPASIRGTSILLEQLRTIDKSRLRERVGALDTSEMKQIDWALGVSVGLVEGYR